MVYYTSKTDICSLSCDFQKVFEDLVRHDDLVRQAVGQVPVAHKHSVDYVRQVPVPLPISLSQPVSLNTSFVFYSNFFDF